jgi:general secretion pathway protein G
MILLFRFPQPVAFRSGAKRSRAGFTLMEMLIVLAIIAMLVGMVAYKLQPVQGVAENQKIDSDLLSFKELLSAYQLETGTLPTTEQGLQALWQKPTAEPVPQRWKPLLEDEVKDPWGHDYQYRNPGKHNPDRYDVWSMGPDGQSDTDDDVGNWKPAATTTSP